MSEVRADERAGGTMRGLFGNYAKPTPGFVIVRDPEWRIGVDVGFIHGYSEGMTVGVFGPCGGGPAPKARLTVVEVRDDHSICVPEDGTDAPDVKPGDAIRVI